MKKIKNQKWWKWTSNILYGFMFTTLLAMLVIVLSSRASGGEPQLFGYQIKTVLSGSMEPAFQTGSVIVVKKLENTEDLKKNDVITFRKDEQSVVTHRIIEVLKQGENTLYRTKGDNNEDPDSNAVLSENVVAKYTGITVPLVGYFLNYASSPIGTAILLVIPGLLLLGYSVFTIRSAIREIEKRAKTATQSTAEEKTVS